MANANITTNFAGKAALPYVAPAILSADAISKKYLQVLTNVAYKAQLQRFSGAKLQAASCTFATPSSGQLALTDVTLTATQLKINEQICNNDLREAWASEQMNGANSPSPAQLQQAAAKYVAARVGESVEYNIWQGNYNIDGGGTSGATHTAFDGILRHIVAGSPTAEFNLGGALSSSNILAKIEQVVNGAPTSILGNYERTKLYLSPASHHMYMKALSALGSGSWMAEGYGAKYAGYDVIVSSGFPNDTILFTQDTNLYFGTGLMTDHTKATIINMLTTTGEDSTRVVMQIQAGTQVVDLQSLSVGRRTT